MRSPKGLRSMGSNNHLLNEYFRAKYIDTQKCLFHISFAFFCRLQESYALSSLFFSYIYFWQNTFLDEPRVVLFLFWRKFQETMCQSEKGIPEILMNYSASSRERTPSGHEKMSVTGAGRLRECKIQSLYEIWEKRGFGRGSVGAARKVSPNWSQELINDMSFFQLFFLLFGVRETHHWWLFFRTAATSLWEVGRK